MPFDLLWPAITIGQLLRAEPAPPDRPTARAALTLGWLFGYPSNRSASLTWPHGHKFADSVPELVTTASKVAIKKGDKWEVIKAFRIV